MAERIFAEVQDELAQVWQPKFDQAESDAERGAILLEFVLERERFRSGITAPGEERDGLDRKTLEKLCHPETLGPKFSRDEAVFRRLASDPASAATYLMQAIRERNEQQSARARKPRPRRRDSITRLIENIVMHNPKISAKDLGRKLETDCDITLLDAEYRHNIDASVLKVSNLPSRVSDARKRLSG
ncbi:hypothetical protein ACFQ3C_13625 [Seohaeicola saemankumensis]|uniref:Uncharacterized protein n=1 Tax=Seohaeicola saemankumensis TaxID=481181 RepID=A0ABW3TET6_9RHOB